MTIIRTAAMLLAATFLLGMLGSCDKLAITGPKKYKVDLSAQLLDIQKAVENDGSPGERRLKKLENFLEANREEFGRNASFVTAEGVLADLKKAETEEANAFQLRQGAVFQIQNIYDILKTEIPD